MIIINILFNHLSYFSKYRKYGQYKKYHPHFYSSEKKPTTIAFVLTGIFSTLKT